MSNRAWVTLATNDSYGLGALVLAHSLRRNGSTYPAVVLITPSVTDAMRDRLSAVFSEVITVDVLDSRDATHLALLQRPELGITFTKIHCWNLTQFEKCVFLDADTLVIQNCDELFEREELSAAPDVGWPDCFNSGVFVYKPSAETFSRLVTFAQERGSFDGGDQGLLNSFFSDWARGDINKHLPFLYNVTSAAFYSYIPALKHYGQNLKIIHFIGATKPWLQQYNWDSKSVNAPDHLKDFLQLWWDIFVGQVHQQLDTTMVEVDQETTEATPELPPQDVLQYYAPTLDPESEFSWHHPDENETKLEENTYDLDVSNFYDPWEHRRGNIPPNVKGDVWQHLDPDNSYQTRHQWEQQQYSQSEQIYQHVSSSTDNRQSQNVGPSHSFHGEQQHMGPGSIQNHNQQNYHYENQDEQNNSYKLNTDSYSHTSQDNHECTHDNYNQEVSYHQHYSEHEHSHFHHHHDYQEPTHQQNHTQHESSHEYHHNEHHHHHSHTHNNEQVNDSPNNYPLKELLNHASEHTHSNKQSHTPTHYLAHLKQKQPQYVYCVHLDHSKPRKKRQNNLKRVEITVTKEMMDGCISEEDTEDCDDIIPRHPYDGFYLRHRITINSRGKKVCTHEIPPIPSPPSTPTVDNVELSDTPELLLDVDNTSNHEDSSSMVSQEQTGVAGNLARVSASPVDAQREAIDELARRQGWEAGNIDYMGADSFDNIWAKISETLNQPRASPPKETEDLPTRKDQVAPAVEPSSQPTEVAVEAAGDPISVQSEALLEPEAKQEDAKTAEGIKTIQPPSEHAVTELKPVESEVKAKANQEIETAIEVTEAPIAELKKLGETLTKVEEPKPVEALSLAESPKLSDTSKTVEVPKLAEVSKPAEAPQVPEIPKSAEVLKAAEVPKSAEAPKLAEITKSAEVAKSAEAPKPVETPKSNEKPKSVEAPQSAATPKSPEVQKVVEAPKAAEVTKPIKAPKPSDTTKPEQAKSPKVEIEKTEPLAVPPTPPTSPKSTPELDSPSESSIPEPVKIAEASLASEIDKETSALLQASDSPPLANTPSKEEAPSTPGAKSEEKRRPAGKLRLSPPQSAPALPTPDSEAEDAATLATAIIAGELTPQPPGLTTSPLGPTSLAQIGVKPKTKPSTADCIESSVSEAKQSETPKKKVVKKVVKKDGSGTEAPVPPPRKKEKKPKDK